MSVKFSVPTVYVTHGLYRWCVNVLSYKKGDDQVDLLSNLLDIAGSQSAGHADLGAV